MSIALLFAAAIAQGPATPPAPAPATDGDARICRKLPAPTGSRVVTRRVCRTAAEWAAIEKATEGDADAMRSRTSRQRSF